MHSARTEEGRTCSNPLASQPGLCENGLLRSLLSILQLALGVWIVAIVLSLSLNAMYEDGAIRSLGDTLPQLQVLKEERSDNHVMTMIISNFQTEDPFTAPRRKPVHRQCLHL